MNDPSFLSRRSGQALTLPLFGEEYSTLIFSLPTELVILKAEIEIWSLHEMQKILNEQISDKSFLKKILINFLWMECI